MNRLYLKGSVYGRAQIKESFMTITAAWVRTLKDCKELIVISDSRLNGSKKMDCAKKSICYQDLTRLSALQETRHGHTR
jgi:hypothetical protein